MQRQLDWMEESGMITQIIEAMDEAEATALWQEYKKFNYTSEIEKLSYMREFRELWNKGGDTTANNAYVAAADSATYGDTYTLTDKNGNTMSVRYSEDEALWKEVDKMVTLSKAARLSMRVELILQILLIRRLEQAIIGWKMESQLLVKISSNGEILLKEPQALVVVVEEAEEINRLILEEVENLLLKKRLKFTIIRDRLNNIKNSIIS